MILKWDEKKNKELQKEGRPSFEEAVIEIINNRIISTDENRKYPGQQIFLIVLQGYPHLVPFEIRGDVIWLITIFPSRKHKVRLR